MIFHLRCWATIVCFAIVSLAQAQPFRFRQLNERSGLSSNHITALQQDRSGMIWIGTANGLNLYDGKRFRAFYHNEWDSTSLPDNRITALRVDRKGRVWVGSNGSVARLNSGDVNFDRFTPAGSHHTHVIYEDDAGRIWCGTDNGLFLFDESKATFKAILQVPAYDIKAMHEQPYLMIVTRKGLLRFDPEHQQTAGNVSDQFRALGGQLYQPSTVSIIRNGFAAGNQLSGFFVANLQTETYTRLSPGDKEAGFSVQCLLNDSTPYIWVGSTRGLYLYSLIDSSLMRAPEFVATSADKALADQYITTLFSDRSGLIWVGTRDNGLYQMGSSYSMFLPYLQPQAPQKRITGFLRLTDSEIAIATETEGIFIWDKDLNLFRQLHKTPFSQANCLQHALNKNEIWIGTTSGLFLWNRERNTFARHLLYTDTLSQSVLCLNAAPNGSLWIGTENGLIQYVPSNKDVFIYPHRASDASSLCSNKVQYLLRDRKNRLWVGTAAGLDLLNERGRSFEHFASTLNSNDPDISYLAEDASGNIWIAMNGSGLAKLQPETHKVIRYSGGRELRNGSLRSLAIQAGRYLWIGSVNGLIRLNMATDEKQYFGVNDGLPSGEHNAASLVLDNGNMLMATQAGFYRIEPGNYQQLQTRTEICISEVLVNDNDVAITDNLLKLLTRPRKLVVRFGISNFTSNSNYVFRYRLEGLDQEWNENPDGEAQFNNLQGGEYNLLASVWVDGEEIVKEKDVLLIDITPPFWQTLAFRILLLVILMALVWWFIRRYLNKVKENLADKHRVEKKMVELELHAYKLQLDSRFISSILYHIQDAIATNDITRANAFLTKFSSLLNLLLEYGDKEYITVEQLALILDFYLAIEKLRLNNQLDYTVECSSKIPRQTTHVPNMIVQPYVQNAIHYGLRLKVKDRKVSVRFEPWSPNHLLCTIEDNGIGRKAASQMRDMHGSEHVKVAEERMEMMEQAHKQETRLEVIDLYNEQSEALGTRVILHLPIVKISN